MNIPSSALVIGAHPDDCDFGAGGTVYTWIRQGCRVTYVVVTDGAAGTAGRDLGSIDLVSARQSEQLEAARILGVQDCRFLGFPDGDVRNDRVLLRELVKTIRELKPQVVFTHTAESLTHRRFGPHPGAAVNHRDHRAVGQTTLDAVYPYAGNPNVYKELGLEAHRVERVYLWGSRHCNIEFDCRDAMESKARAMAAHKTQFPESVDWDALKRAWGSVEQFEYVELT